jgi:threonyl-tRNA synthetase
MAVIGDREVVDGTVALRRRDDREVVSLSPAEVTERIAALSERRLIDLELP